MYKFLASLNLFITIQSFYYIAIFVKRYVFSGLATKNHNDYATEKVIPVKSKIPKKCKSISGFPSDSYFLEKKGTLYLEN